MADSPSNATVKLVLEDIAEKKRLQALEAAFPGQNPEPPVETVPGRSCFLPAPHAFHLDRACAMLFDAFGARCYLVGSVLQKRDYRDVDVRLILADEQFDHLFPGSASTHRPRGNALWSIMCSTISDWLGKQSGLPVDFQIQRMTQANEDYPSQRREALGLFYAPSYAQGKP